MDRKKLIDMILSSGNYSEEQKDILVGFQEAQEELESAISYFNQVSDSGLVDYAIYKETAARVKFEHYLKMAKKNNINIDIKKVI